MKVNPSIAAVAFTALVVILAGCGDREAIQPTEPEPWEGAVAFAVGSKDALDKELGEILHASMELTRPVTATIGEGDQALEVPGRRPHDEQALPGTWSVTPPPLFPRPEYVPGRRLFTLTNPPGAFALGDGGVVFHGDGEGLYRRVEGRSSQRILDGEVTFLQFNAEATVLLAKVDEDVVFLDAPNFDTPRVHPHELPSGRVMWGVEDGELLVVSELIQFTSTEERRIFLDLYNHDISSGSTRAARWPDSHRLARTGTIPQLDMVWGHLWRRYQVDPIPAPLFLVTDGEIGGMVTGMDGMADVQPSANRDGHLFWIRTPRHESRAGRAWWRMPGDGASAEETQLTGRPTTHVAAAPGGGLVAYVTEGTEGHWEVRMVDISELESRRPALARMRETHVGVENKIKDFERALERDLLALEVGKSIKPSEFGTFLYEIPTVDEISAMGDALRTRAREQFGVTLGSGHGSSSRLDMILRETAGRIEEHPALILGVSSVLVDALPGEPVWYLDGATTGSLSVDVRDPRHTDGMTFQALLPFGIAREAIAGRFSLEEITREVLADEHLPVFLLENFRTDTLLDLRLHQLRLDGYNAETDNLGDLMDRLRDDDTPALAYMAVEQGMWMRREALALLGALKLARSAPTNAEAMFHLGEALSLLYLLEEARPFLEQAVALEPTRVDLRIALADCLLTLDLVEEAAGQYTLARLADTSAVYHDVLNGREEVLRIIERERENEQ
ncbi:MAG: tetratricopeptide repeat protein [Candidatus Sumerlaeia bacterium]|nr:tetratricopeptide repeat protein [Candidatus Sumerlaeia bacterium]